MADVIQNIRQAYRLLLQNDSQLSQLRAKVVKGDLTALQKYSMRAGQLAVDALQESVSNESIDQSSIQDALDGVFRENYNAVMNAASTAQKAQNRASGIGLNASDSDYSGENVKAIAERLNSYDDLSEGLSSISNDIVMQSQRYADDSERRSAQFDNDSGLEVLVSREYDDVGVHTTDKGGGQPCQWCLDRCGTDVPYEEAYEKGMFERHPGCGCIITYKTKKGILRQGKGDWQDNSWSEESESTRQRRIERLSTDNELQRRRKGSQGQEIIDKPTYNKITKSFIRAGGTIIRGDEAKRHLEKVGAFASYIPGMKVAFIRDDATVSDVLEEMYHAKQDRSNRFSNYPNDEIILRREIETQEYLISVKNKYKIPIEEQRVTEKNLEYYQDELNQLLEKKRRQG